MADDEEDSNYSVVAYMSDHSGHRCGYCKSKDTNYSHGMWAHELTVQNYQDIIDRGWRRSGKYCYKPTMQKTCCPQYTIKCDPLQFKLSNSQKKVLKRMHAFLSYDKQRNTSTSFEGNDVHESAPSQFQPQTAKALADVKTSINSFKKQNEATENGSEMSCEENAPLESLNKVESDATPQRNVSTKKGTTVNPGLGCDTSKPPCKKAKLLRQERHCAKLAAASTGPAEPRTKRGTANQAKSLEDFLNALLPESPTHRLELRLVRASEDMANKRLSYGVFRDYQMTIHGDPPDECKESSFDSFLVDGPLTPWNPGNGPPDGYGPYHQQYWLDGELIAVGVLDVLPRCVSSVYLFYNPKFSFLSLGVYSSLREIALTRQLHRCSPSLRWYYMGFYIHSCPKMRYKGNYYPSFLLCPETYTWVPIEKCVPKLDASKYSSLSDDVTIQKEKSNIDLVRCLWRGMPCSYQALRNRNKNRGDEEEVTEYMSLAGTEAASSILLYRD